MERRGSMAQTTAASADGCRGSMGLCIDLPGVQMRHPAGRQPEENHRLVVVNKQPGLVPAGVAARRRRCLEPHSGKGQCRLPVVLPALLCPELPAQRIANGRHLGAELLVPPSGRCDRSIDPSPAETHKRAISFLWKRSERQRKQNAGSDVTGVQLELVPLPLQPDLWVRVAGFADLAAAHLRGQQFVSD